MNTSRGRGGFHSRTFQSEDGSGPQRGGALSDAQATEGTGRDLGVPTRGLLSQVCADGPGNLHFHKLPRRFPKVPNIRVSALTAPPPKELETWSYIC